jgi:hypothetical protein
MQAPTSTDFTCLPPEIITAIALTSGQVWRSLARVNHMCSGTLSWKEFVQRFSSVGVVTQLFLGGAYSQETVHIIDTKRTSITLLDGVPHSEGNNNTWKVEAGTRYSPVPGAVTRVFESEISSGIYKRGKIIGPRVLVSPVFVVAFEWDEPVR